MAGGGRLPANVSAAGESQSQKGAHRHRKPLEQLHVSTSLPCSLDAGDCRSVLLTPIWGTWVAVWGDAMGWTRHPCALLHAQ